MQCREVSTVSWMLKIHGLRVGVVWLCNHYSDFACQSTACIWVWWESNVAKWVSRAITKGRGMAEHGLAQKAWAVLGSFTEGRLAVPQPWGAQGTRGVTGLPSRTAWGPTWRGRPGMEGEPCMYPHLWLIPGTTVCREMISQALGMGTRDDCHPGSSSGWKGGDLCPHCCPVSCAERTHDHMVSAAGSHFWGPVEGAFSLKQCSARFRETAVSEDEEKEGSRGASLHIFGSIKTLTRTHALS